MPELPEVETTLRGIRPHLEGETIRAVRVWESRLRWPVATNLEELLVGASFGSIRRRGKYLILPLTGIGSLIVHLGMSGSLRMVSEAQERRRHDHLELVLSTGWCLRYHDPRRFGCVLFASEPDLHPLIRNLGPEPLGSSFTEAVLFQSARQKKTSIKSLIMDSGIVVGVGNIYANEALFLAGISPFRKAQDLSLRDCQCLVEAIQTVLGSAIEMGGTTLRDFVNASGQPGYFSQTLNVYGREGKPCPNCGIGVASMRQNQRSSYWCPVCQI